MARWYLNFVENHPSSSIIAHNRVPSGLGVRFHNSAGDVGFIILRAILVSIQCFSVNQNQLFYMKV